MTTSNSLQTRCSTSTGATPSEGPKQAAFTPTPLGTCSRLSFCGRGRNRRHIQRRRKKLRWRQNRPRQNSSLTATTF